MLELESLPAPLSQKKKPDSKAKFGKRNIKNNPATLGEKKVKLPPTSFRRPGLILPKQCRKNCHETAFGLVDTSIIIVKYSGSSRHELLAKSKKI